METDLIRVNGERRPSTARSVEELIRELGHTERRGIAVAVNGVVVPRTDWASHGLRTGDSVEIVGAVQGG